MLKIKLILKEEHSRFIDLYTIVDEDQSHYLNKKLTIDCLGNKLYPYYLDDNFKYVKIHQEIMGFPEGKHVHHINGNTLDNRRSNLQILEPKEHLKMKKHTQKLNDSNYLLIPINFT